MTQATLTKQIRENAIIESKTDSYSYQIGQPPENVTLDFSFPAGQDGIPRKRRFIELLKKAQTDLEAEIKNFTMVKG